MVHTRKIYGIVGVLLGLLCLTACGAPTLTSAPSPDLNLLRTEVAATVLAQVTRDLALTPSITPLPSATATPPPSATPTETAPPPPSATATLSTITPGANVENRAQWVSQTIPDGTTFVPGETFTITWRIKNVGTSTWTAGYLVRFYSGDTFGAPKEVPLGQEVPPGETIDITLQMKAPIRPGAYRSVWVISTENRSNFKEPFFLEIVVGSTATPSPTP